MWDRIPRHKLYTLLGGRLSFLSILLFFHPLQNMHCRLDPKFYFISHHIHNMEKFIKNHTICTQQYKCLEKVKI